MNLYTVGILLLILLAPFLRMLIEYAVLCLEQRFPLKVNGEPGSLE